MSAVIGLQKQRGSYAQDIKRHVYRTYIAYL